VLDIELQALEGAAQTGKIVAALAAGDKVDKNDNAFGTSFPYLALPNGVAVNTAGSGFATKVSSNMMVGAGGVAAAGGAAFLAFWWRRKYRLTVKKSAASE